MNLKRYFNRFLLPISFAFGFFASVGALNYSGKNLVNVLYFLFFIVFLPFLVSLFSLIFKRAYKNSSLAGLLFSIGAFFGLIITITTQDIAFGWATTLNISPKEFHKILSAIAIWKWFCSSCIPSVELIEISKISRLGHMVSQEQIKNAALLGQWWKFLAMSLLVYGILWRLLIYLISLIVKPKPINIDIIAKNEEPKFEDIDTSYQNITDFNDLKQREFKLISYNVDTKALNLQSNPEAKDIVVAVRAYEPPLLEFFDELEEILQSAKGRVSLLLVGLNGKPKQENIDIWIKKIKELGLNLEVIV